MKSLMFILMGVILAAFAFGFRSPDRNLKETKEEGIAMEAQENHLSTATFAGGCFWCVEADFEKVDGVEEVISGYTDGHRENPTYEDVSAGVTGHTEAVQVIYNISLLTEQTSGQEQSWQYLRWYSMV